MDVARADLSVLIASRAASEGPTTSWTISRHAAAWSSAPSRIEPSQKLDGDPAASKSIGHRVTSTFLATATTSCENWEKFETRSAVFDSWLFDPGNPGDGSSTEASSEVYSSHSMDRAKLGADE